MNVQDLVRSGWYRPAEDRASQVDAPFFEQADDILKDRMWECPFDFHSQPIGGGNLEFDHEHCNTSVLASLRHLAAPQNLVAIGV